MDLFGAQPTTLAPGQRILKLKGYNAVDRYSMPRDCEAFFLDEDEDVGYIKKTDNNGNAKILMFDMVEKEIPVFDPNKYVTKQYFDEFKEEILNGISDLKQTFSNGKSTATKRTGSEDGIKSAS